MEILESESTAKAMENDELERDYGPDLCYGSRVSTIGRRVECRGFHRKFEQFPVECQL